MVIGVRIVSLDHLVLTVADLEATVAFYERLGMRRVVFGDGRLALRFGDQKLNLHRRDAEIAPYAAVPTPGSADLCFIVADSTEAVVAELNEAGIDIELGPVTRTGAISCLNRGST